MTLGGVGGGPRNLGKHLEWRDRDETLVGKISRSPRYLIDISKTGPLYLWGVGGGGMVNSGKLEKNAVFLTYKGVIGS